MRYAVLLYGEFREFQLARKSMDFIESLGCDVYFSTWDYSLQINDGLKIRREKYIDEKTVLNVDTNIKVSILKESDFFEDFNLNHENKNRTLRVMTHWKNGLKMIEDSCIHYDILILTRPDLFIDFRSSEEYLKEIFETKDGIYGITELYKETSPIFLSMDIFFIGNFQIMKNFINDCPLNLAGMHTALAEYIISKNLCVHPLKTFVSIGVIRPNCLELNEDEFTFMKVVEKHKIYEYHYSRSLLN